MQISIDVPDGKNGNWSVETFIVSQKDADFYNMRAAFSFSGGGRYIKPGTYKKLKRSGQTIMSNTPSEISDHRIFISMAKRDGGNILINGLGLGVCLKAILESDKIQSVTVVELSENVINLVGSTYLADPRVQIFYANALEYKPPKRVWYSCVWHDIWDSICVDNLSEIHKLHRKYGKRCDWQGSWCREECERQR